MKQAQRISKATKEKLVAFAALYENENFLDGDPSWFMHQVDGTQNKEVMAFMAACLSYGSRKVFMPRIQFLLDCAKGNPYKWIVKEGFRRDIPDNSACFYRLYTNHTMHAFFSVLAEMLNRYGSIAGYIKHFASEKNSKATDKIEAIVAIEALCAFFAERQVVGLCLKTLHRRASVSVCFCVGWCATTLPLIWESGTISSTNGRL